MKTHRRPHHKTTRHVWIPQWKQKQLNLQQQHTRAKHPGEIIWQQRGGIKKIWVRPAAGISTRRPENSKKSNLFCSHQLVSRAHKLLLFQNLSFQKVDFLLSSHLLMVGSTLLRSQVSPFTNRLHSPHFPSASVDFLHDHFQTCLWSAICEKIEKYA